MNRKLAIAGVVALVAASVVFAAAPSHAGGFCGEGNFTDRDTTQVVMEGMCFSPTVARIDAGDSVTFSNKDKATHAVGGVTNIFGDLHRELMPNESVSYRFAEEGVYPYVCIYHPGMGGAIVVGDGKGEASGAAVTEVFPGTSDQEPASALEEEPTPSSPRWVVPMAVTVLAAGLVLVALQMRKRSPTRAI